jgi:D-glucosaminate-specific PTS system IIC component
MSLTQALIIGLIYWISTNKMWYGTLHFMRTPLFLALPLGLVMGDVQMAMIIGAALQLIYLGVVAPGGNLPADEAFAACVAIPVAIQTGITAQIAITIAVPVGLLGILLDNLRRTYASLWVRMADKAAIEGDIQTLSRAGFWYPLLCAVPLRFIPAFLASYFGPTVVQAFLKAIPSWATNGLTVAGGVLPALGFAVTMIVIGKQALIPYFVLGFLLVSYSGINVIGIALVGICIALIQTQYAPAHEVATGGDGDE